MNVWLVTTGSSDVQLRTNDHWNQWHQQVRKSYYKLPFAPKQAVDEVGEPYRIAPRVLGTVYEAFPDQVWADLTFPLLDAFRSKLQEETINKILLLVTDQSEIFDEDQRNEQRCPYWQDTSALLPVFELYFQEHFPDAEVIPLYLKPEANSTGLDDWNQVLEVVRQSINGVTLEPEMLYVSHQAGTPAISSAVQFVSLARFRANVQFLVSNEYQPEQTRTIPQSTYLRGIQLQEAKALLERRDYAGVKELLRLGSGPDERRISFLLDAAIQWNFAEFQNFKKIIEKRKLLAIEEFPWWQSGYESAYLAWTRLQQGSPVDAMFHSFRAVEGTSSKWVEKKYVQYVRRDPKNIRTGRVKRGLFLDSSICDAHNGMKSWFEISDKPDKPLKLELGMYGKPLFALLREATHWDANADVKIFLAPLGKQYDGKDIFDERNNLFHRIEGFQREELFDAWSTATEAEWLSRVLGCLNFISEQAFSSLESASLMAQVHHLLLDAIVQL